MNTNSLNTRLTRRNNKSNSNTKNTNNNKNTRKNNNNSKKNSNYTDKTIIVFILGTGCSLQVNPKDYNKDTLFFVIPGENIQGIDTHYICSRKLYGGPVKNIVKSYCGVTPSKNDKFVKGMYDYVKGYLEDGYNVYLVGHSYGGSVVSRIAEIIQEDKDKEKYKNLKMVTMGSIYIPKPERVDSVQNLFHVLFRYDVSLKCNGIKNNEDRDDILWLNHPIRDYGYNLTRKSMLGTVAQWHIHKDYGWVLPRLLLLTPDPEYPEIIPKWSN